MCIDIYACMRIGMCIGMCIDMFIGMSIDMYIHMFIDMCMDMCVGMLGGSPFSLLHVLWEFLGFSRLYHDIMVAIVALVRSQ